MLGIYHLMIVKQGEVLNNRDYGPIYPMEFRYRTCEKIEGENTRTCHCAEGTQNLHLVT